MRRSLSRVGPVARTRIGDASLHITAIVKGQQTQREFLARSDDAGAARITIAQETKPKGNRFVNRRPT
jgi:hypothetical protein